MYKEDNIISGTKEGALKVKAKLLAKDPNHYAKIGRVGGIRSTTGGFYADHELARRAGAIGGRISKRKPKVV